MTVVVVDLLEIAGPHPPLHLPRHESAARQDRRRIRHDGHGRLRGIAQQGHLVLPRKK